MAKFDQFGSASPGLGGNNRDCLRYEAMLADVIDGTLSAEEQAAFERHRETCDSCSEMLKDARRGVAWLEMLKPYRPEPSATLVDRILAETSVRAAQEAEIVRAAQRAAAEAASILGPVKGAPPAAAESSTVAPGKVLPFRRRIPTVLQPAVHTVLQPRFAMTAAMAFFSVALTLNLTGVQLKDLHARDLRPASLRRSFYEANAHVVRYYENLRVVYELESRVRDLQRTSEADPAQATPAPQSTPDQPKSEKPGGSNDSKPAGKPRSGLGSGSESRDRQGHVPGLHPRDESDLARRRSVFVAPSGAIPVSLSYSLPGRQKRGLV